MKNKHKMGFLSLCFVSMIGLCGQAQATFYDLYAGMLKKQGEQFVLSKCSLVSTDFILRFENDALKKKLPDLSENSLVQLYVKGEVQQENGKYYLMVHDINRIRIGSSCNL